METKKEIKKWKTYKIRLTDRQIDFLDMRKKNFGTPIGWTLSTAVAKYIAEEESQQGKKVVVAGKKK